MRRAQTTLEPQLRIGLAPFLHGAHHAPLSGNDDEEHIRHHDRAHHRAELDEGAASAEQRAQRPRGCREEHAQDAAQRDAIARERRAAQTIVDEPATHDERESDSDGCWFR